MPIILRLLAAGVPAAKIIAKYGKTAYDNAKKIWDNAKKLEGFPKFSAPVKPRGRKLDKSEKKFIKNLVKDVKKEDVSKLYSINRGIDRKSVV